MDYSQYIGSAGSAFASVIVLATYSMKTMIPLRIFGILSNVVFINNPRCTPGAYVITGPCTRSCCRSIPTVCSR